MTPDQLEVIARLKYIAAQAEIMVLNMNDSMANAWNINNDVHNIIKSVDIIQEKVKDIQKFLHGK